MVYDYPYYERKVGLLGDTHFESGRAEEGALHRDLDDRVYLL